MMRQPTFVAMLAMAIALPLAAGTAAAQIVIEVGAQEQQAWSDGRSFFPPTTRAWGWAQAAQNAASGQFGTGPAPCDNIVCTPGPTLPGVAGAIARADASAFNVGVRAWAAGAGFTPSAMAEVEVADHLVTTGFTSLVFDIHLDVLFAVSPQPGSAGRYSTSIRLGGGDAATVPFAFIAERRFTSAQVYETSAVVLLDNGATELALPQLPGIFDMSLTLPFAPGSTALLVSASALSDAPDGGSSNVNAYNSAWLGIRGAYASANGYAYPGFTPVVPEPGTALLLAVGLAAIAARGRRSCSRGPAHG